MTVSDIAAANVRKIRNEYGWKPADLARRCAHIGAPWLTENTIENIESGRRDKEKRRRRNITVDELLALAVALDVAPVHLLVPTDEGVNDPAAGKITVYPVTDETWTDRPTARNWIRGYKALGEQDPRRYYSHVPPGEFKPPFVPDEGEIATRSAFHALTRKAVPESVVPDGPQEPGNFEMQVTDTGEQRIYVKGKGWIPVEVDDQGRLVIPEDGDV